MRTYLFFPTRKWFYSGIILIIISSCAIKYKIPANHKALIPYKGNETLVFVSNKGGRDTIFLQNKWHYYSKSSDFTSPINRKFEHINIRCMRTSEYCSTNKLCYSDNHLMVRVSAGKEKNSRIQFNLQTKDAGFYGESWMPVREFVTLPTIWLTLNNNVIKDVVILEDKKKEYYNRSNYVERIYWSKNYGLLRYDKKAGEIWTLQTNLFL